MAKRILALILILTLPFVAWGATNFPSALDSYSAKTSSDLITAAGWNNLQDAIAALEAKVGIDSSAVSTSHDYKIYQLEGYWTTSGVTDADLIKLHAIDATEAEIDEICNATNKPIVGNTSVGVVLRVATVTLTGNSAGSDKIAIANTWNGDALSETNLSDSATYYDFNTTGNALTVIGCFITRAKFATGYEDLTIRTDIASNNIRIYWYHENLNISLDDFLADSATNQVIFTLVYLTDS